MAGQTDDRDDRDDEYEEDATSAAIRAALDAQGFNDDDPEELEGGFDTDLGEGERREVVRHEDGAEMAAEARIKGDVEDPKKPKDEAEVEAKPEAEAEDEPEAAEKPEGEDEKPEEPGEAEPEVDLTALATDDLMKGVPHKTRSEIVRRIDAAEKAMAPFRKPYMQQQLERFGATPEQMAGRMADLAEFAATRPDEYIAWVATEMASAPDKVPEVLNAAAERLGFKVVPNRDDDDDLFEDERVRELREENERLKRQTMGTSFGPDTPERMQARHAQDQLTAWQFERDETGNLRRPHFQQLEPQITQMAAARQAQLRRAITVQDLDDLYQMAATMNGLAQPVAPAPLQSPAAQPPGAVANRIQTQAAAAEKAARASKNVDGSGQGGSRRPALASDADIGEVIRAMLSN